MLAQPNHTDTLGLTLGLAESSGDRLGLADWERLGEGDGGRALPHDHRRGRDDTSR